MFGLSIWELLIILAIVILVFGPSRLKTIGSDLGNAIKGFRTAIKEEPAEKVTDDSNASESTTTADKTDQKTNV